MRIALPTAQGCVRKKPDGAAVGCADRGVAVLVVLVVLGLLAILLIANARVLAHLKAEISFLDKKQQEKFQVQPQPARPENPPVREPAPPRQPNSGPNTQ